MTVHADGHTELSLTVPITNSLAFLFTVLGEWWAEGKVISRGQLLCSSSFGSIVSLTVLQIHGLEWLSCWEVSRCVSSLRILDSI